MSALINTKNIIRNTIIACILLIISIVGVYIFTFWDRTIGNPSDFANFATYVGNLVMPVLTAGTIIVLLFTFQHQKKLFHEEKLKNEQDKNSRQFQKYTEKSEFYLDLHKKMAKTPVGYSETNDAIILAKIPFLVEGSNEYVRASEFIDEIGPIMEIVKEHGLNPALVPANKFSAVMFLMEMLNYLGHSCRLLHHSYKYAHPHDSGLIHITNEEVSIALIEANSWGLISNEEYSLLTNLIQIPPYLAEIQI